MVPGVLAGNSICSGKPLFVGCPFGASAGADDSFVEMFSLLLFCRLLLVWLWDVDASTASSSEGDAETALRFDDFELDALGGIAKRYCFLVESIGRVRENKALRKSMQWRREKESASVSSPGFDAL